MRAVAASLLLIAMLASSAGAQPATTTTTVAPPPSHCGAIQPAPHLPDPASASRDQMTAGMTAFQTWSADTHTKLECQRVEVEQLTAQAQAARDAYNASAGQYNTVVDGWTRSVTAFNSHHNSSHHEAGALLTH